VLDTGSIAPVAPADPTVVTVVVEDPPVPVPTPAVGSDQGTVAPAGSRVDDRGDDDSFDDHGDDDRGEDGDDDRGEEHDDDD
jgi:hypothetical protein